MSEPNEREKDLLQDIYDLENTWSQYECYALPMIAAYRESIEAPLKARIEELEAKVPEWSDPKPVSVEEMMAALDNIPREPPDGIYLSSAAWNVLSNLAARARQMEAQLAAERAKRERMREALVLSAEIFDKVRTIEQYESWEGGSPDLGTAKTLGRIKEISKIARAALDAEKEE